MTKPPGSTNLSCLSVWLDRCAHDRDALLAEEEEEYRSLEEEGEAACDAVEGSAIAVLLESCKRVFRW